MAPQVGSFGTSRPRARIVMITAMTASEKASSRSVVRATVDTDLVGSLIAAMICLALRSARWKDGCHERRRPTRGEGAAAAARRLADVRLRRDRGHLGAAPVRPRRRVLPAVARRVR